MTDLEAKIQRASAGDREVLRELVAAHLGDLERFIRRRTGDRFLGKESLADLVQSAAREALAYLGTHDFKGPAAFEAWLYKIALTKIVARHRHYHAARRDIRREAAEDPQLLLGQVCAQFGSPSEAAMANEFEARFVAAFAQLSQDHQQVFFLGRVLEMPHSLIAQQMQRSELACRNLLLRAVSRLGSLLGHDHPPGAG